MEMGIRRERMSNTNGTMDTVGLNLETENSDKQERQ